MRSANPENHEMNTTMHDEDKFGYDACPVRKCVWFMEILNKFGNVLRKHLMINECMQVCRGHGIGQQRSHGREAGRETSDEDAAFHQWHRPMTFHALSGELDKRFPSVSCFGISCESLLIGHLASACRQVLWQDDKGFGAILSVARFDLLGHPRPHLMCRQHTRFEIFICYSNPNGNIPSKF